MGIRLLICGDRAWTDADLIGLHIDNAKPDVIIEGEARGADLLARICAERRGIPVLAFPAQWSKYHRAAGPIRNQQMIDEGRPDLVLAFHDNIASSRGTADMVWRARRAGIECRVVAHGP